MRKPFLEQLMKLAEQDDKMLVIIGDVGFSYIEGFREKFPKQFLNVGVCEQTMMGVAAGFARVGFKPYVYTMTNFILLRPLEQVRNDICYPKANVKLFGVKGREAFRFDGYSHNLSVDEEKTIASLLPNLNSYYPTTEEETVEVINKEYRRSGPAYFSI